MITDFTRILPQVAELPFAPLINEATPWNRLDRISDRFGLNLVAKREDLTDSIYGGNKVRNLEFILGAVQAAGLDSVYTLAPLGSNFIAALAAQTKRLGIRAYVEHFTPTVNAQVLDHYEFSKTQGASLRRYRGRSGVVPASLRSVEHLLAKRIWISPGGSNALGALGHVNAALEFAEQIKQAGEKEPDFIYVGVGTCGTLAGLTVGFRLAGWKTRIIGVRCVDAFLCNRRKLAVLANRVSRLLRLDLHWTAEDFNLVAPKIGVEYGVSHPAVDAAILLFGEEEGLTLDTTYTGKVVAHLLEDARLGKLFGSNVVYWHTFSSRALKSSLATKSPRSKIRSMAF